MKHELISLREKQGHSVWRSVARPLVARNKRGSGLLWLALGLVTFVGCALPGQDGMGPTKRGAQLECTLFARYGFLDEDAPFLRVGACTVVGEKTALAHFSSLRPAGSSWGSQGMEQAWREVGWQSAEALAVHARDAAYAVCVGDEQRCGGAGDVYAPSEGALRRVAQVKLHPKLVEHNATGQLPRMHLVASDDSVSAACNDGAFSTPLVALGFADEGKLDVPSMDLPARFEGPGAGCNESKPHLAEARVFAQDGSAADVLAARMFEEVKDSRDHSAMSAQTWVEFRLGDAARAGSLVLVKGGKELPVTLMVDDTNFSPMEYKVALKGVQSDDLDDAAEGICSGQPYALRRKQGDMTLPTLPPSQTSLSLGSDLGAPVLWKPANGRPVLVGLVKRVDVSLPAPAGSSHVLPPIGEADQAWAARAKTSFETERCGVEATVVPVPRVMNFLAPLSWPNDNATTDTSIPFAGTTPQSASAAFGARVAGSLAVAP